MSDGMKLTCDKDGMKVPNQSFPGSFQAMFSERTFYENAYVINLQRRVDRWAVTRDHLHSIGFRPSRYEAVDGSSIPDSFVGILTTSEARKSIKRGYRHEHHEISLGSVGCSLRNFA